MKCHTILFDSVINRQETVITTIYQLFLLAGLRTHSFLKQMKLRNKKRINTKHLCRAYHEAIEFGKRLIQLRINVSTKPSRTLRLGKLRSSSHSNTRSNNPRENSGKNSRLSETEGNNNIKNAPSPSLFFKVLKNPKIYPVKCDLKIIKIEWLICDAFLQVICSTNGRYPELLRFLKKKVSVCENNIKRNTIINMRNILDKSHVLDILKITK